MAWKNLLPSNLRDICDVRGAVKGEILMASYNEKYGTHLLYTDFPYLRTNPNDISSSIDTLYMPHLGNGAYNNCKGYWLASNTNNATLKTVNFDGRITEFSYNNQNYGVCPVMCLPSSIKLTKNNGVWNITL